MRPSQVYNGDSPEYIFLVNIEAQGDPILLDLVVKGRQTWNPNYNILQVHMVWSAYHSILFAHPKMCSKLKHQIIYEHILR